MLPAQSHAKVILLEVVPLMSKSIALMSMCPPPSAAEPVAAEPAAAEAAAEAAAASVAISCHLWGGVEGHEKTAKEGHEDGLDGVLRPRGESVA